MMEDYEVFVQHRLSELRKSTEEEWRPTAASSSSSSLIRFYGRAILPPLLSKNDKEEMQLYRKHVKKDAVRRKAKDDTRMAYVQTVLHSVQLRTTPTLDELLQEQHSNRSAETNHGISPQSLIETSGVALPPLTPTPSSAFTSSEKSHHERCLLDKVDSQPASQPSSFTGTSHQSMSSDYVTFDDVENTKSASDCIEVQTRRPAHVSSERIFNFSGFFLHSSSTITKIPDIINHPPIDGEELERSGVETSFCHDFIAVKDICGSSFQEDSVMCDNLPVDKSEGTSLNDVEHEEEFKTSITLDSDKVGHLEQKEELFSLSENSNISDNTDTSQTLSDHNQKTEPTHNQEDDSDSVPSAEPHRPSLQALLKKSQEYRRRQRMLRNQARNNKTQERNREPQRTSDEQSHSDKENDGFPHKDITTAVEKEMNHMSAFISSDSCIKKPWESEKKKEGELILWSKNDQSENTHSQGHGDTKESVEEETNFRNQQNYSQEVKAHGIYHTVPISDGAKTHLAESVVSNVSSESLQHDDQLKSNLSSVKVLISDLQSTVRENSAKHSQSENTQSDLSFTDVQDSQQNEPVVKHSDDEEELRTLRRQSINNVPEGSELEPYFTGTKCVSLQRGEKEAETFIETSLGKSSTKVQGLSEEEQTKPPAKGSLSIAQWKPIPEMFRTVSSETLSACDISVLSDTCSHSVEKREEFYTEGHDSIRSDSLNQSYNVDTPSGLWFQEESGSNFGSQGCLVRVQHLTPESDSELQTSVSKVKRRLDLHLSEGVQENKAELPVVRRLSSTYRAALRGLEGGGDHRDKQEQLKQTHAAQRRALQEEHRKQQEELQQTSSSSLQCYRPLLAAVLKGFLTRRLLRTERAAQLVRTIRDTQQFLQAFEKQQQQILSRHDIILLERVTLQLRAARYEIYDMFFSLSAREQMLLISRDRELNRERELRRLSGSDDRLKEKSSLSAATRKSLERKRGVLFQKKAAESHTRIIKKTEGKTGFSAEQPPESRRPQIRRNPQRVLKTTPSPRPR
uniref:Uncharacterized LOC114472309 n=1 Tax=Gouania willdenowi TaxID=441366 RepID=A0A8C5G6G2_GOUWI